MRVVELALQDFRNFQTCQTSFQEGMNVIVGPNGSGKTSLLEAISFALTGRSIRKMNKQSAMIRYTQSAASKEVDEEGRASHISLRVQNLVEDRIEVNITHGGRQTTIDGKRIRDLKELVRRYPVVSFVPEDRGFIKDAPTSRRDALDRLCFSLFPDYVDAFKDFQRLLAQRKAILQSENSSWRQELEHYDGMYAKASCEVITRRLSVLDLWLPKAIEVLAEISGGRLELSGGYVCQGLDEGLNLEQAANREALYEAFQTRMSDLAVKERMARRVLLGPHRDDVELMLASAPARFAASQGETRALVLAFKIAALKLLAERHEQTPVLMLDDVTGELDAERRSYLFDVVRSMDCQVFVTTPSENELSELPAAEIIRL